MDRCRHTIVINNMNAKEFIQKELIDGIGQIIDNCPFIAFMAMSAGIEFLGKCLDTKNGWDKRDSTAYFRNAINTLFPYAYQQANTSDNLYHSLRCGLLHSCLPDSDIALSNKGDCFRTITIEQTPRTIISCKQLYDDFSTACKIVINDSSLNSKTDTDFYTVKESNSESLTAATQTNIVVPATSSK